MQFPLPGAPLIHIGSTGPPWGAAMAWRNETKPDNTPAHICLVRDVQNMLCPFLSYGTMEFVRLRCLEVSSNAHASQVRCRNVNNRNATIESKGGGSGT